MGPPPKLRRSNYCPNPEDIHLYFDTKLLQFFEMAAINSKGFSS
jgi:hypothetical protein